MMDAEISLHDENLFHFETADCSRRLYCIQSLQILYGTVYYESGTITGNSLYNENHVSSTGILADTSKSTFFQ
jgi:hypothetical protein